MTSAILTINLYLWTMVGFQGTMGAVAGDWVFAGEFISAEACHRAAENLGKKANAHRCIDSKGELK